MATYYCTTGYQLRIGHAQLLAIAEHNPPLRITEACGFARFDYGDFSVGCRIDSAAYAILKLGTI
jgi:hypothetical protein